MNVIKQLTSIQAELEQYTTDQREANKSIIANALTYLHFRQHLFDIKTVSDHFSDQLFCTFRMVLKQVNSPIDIDDQISKIAKDNVELKSALHLYTAMGAFHWVDAEASRFSSNLHSNQLTEEDGINCFDAILYGLLKGEVLDKQTVLKMSKWKTSTLVNAIGANYAEPLTSLDMLSQKPYLIFLNKPGDSPNDGIYHAMVSFPHSMEDLLTTLVESHQTSLIRSGTVFSLWVNLNRPETGLGRLGAFKASELINYANGLSIRILPLNKAVKSLQAHLIEADKMDRLFQDFKKLL